MKVTSITCIDKVLHLLCNFIDAKLACQNFFSQKEPSAHCSGDMHTTLLTLSESWRWELWRNDLWTFLISKNSVATGFNYILFSLGLFCLMDTKHNMKCYFYEKWRLCLLCYFLLQHFCLKNLFITFFDISEYVVHIIQNNYIAHGIIYMLYMYCKSFVKQIDGGIFLFCFSAHLHIKRWNSLIRATLGRSCVTWAGVEVAQGLAAASSSFPFVVVSRSRTQITHNSQLS